MRITQAAFHVGPSWAQLGPSWARLGPIWECCLGRTRFGLNEIKRVSFTYLSHNDLPVEKGMKAGFFIIFPSASIHLSGLKVSGSSKYFLSLSDVRRLRMMILSLGMVYPPSSVSELAACHMANGAANNDMIYYTEEMQKTDTSELIY